MSSSPRYQALAMRSSWSVWDRVESRHVEREIRARDGKTGEQRANELAAAFNLEVRLSKLHDEQREMEKHPNYPWVSDIPGWRALTEEIDRIEDLILDHPGFAGAWAVHR